MTTPQPSAHENRQTLARRARRAVRNTTVALAASFLLGACGVITPTTYQPMGEEGGYQSTWLAQDTAEIEIQGNKWTRAHMVRSLGLYHAANLAQSRGFSHFTIAEAELKKTTSMGPTINVRPAHLPYNVNPHQPGHVTIPITQSWTYLNERLVVRFWNEPPSGLEDDEVYEATAVIARLASKYE